MIGGYLSKLTSKKKCDLKIDTKAKEDKQRLGTKKKTKASHVKNVPRH